MAEASGGPKPKQGTKRAQWETHGDREGRVALSWLKTDPATDDGGKSCEKGVQVQTKNEKSRREWSGRQTAAAYGWSCEAAQEDCDAGDCRETAEHLDIVIGQEPK